MYIYTCSYVYSCTYIYICICMYIYISQYFFACLYTFLHDCARTYTHKDTYTYVYVRFCFCVSVYVCACMHIYLKMHIFSRTIVWSLLEIKHTYTHTHSLIQLQPCTHTQVWKLKKKENWNGQNDIGYYECNGHGRARRTKR